MDDDQDRAVTVSRTFPVAIGVLFAAVAANVVAAAGGSPVMIGSEPGLDACGSLGAVTSATLSVRDGPGSAFRRIDSLAKGRTVFVCSSSPDGEWTGVVYADGSEPDCGVSSPVPEPQPYAGACRSGWVRSKWITIIAG